MTPPNNLVLPSTSKRRTSRNVSFKISSGNIPATCHHIQQHPYVHPLYASVDGSTHPKYRPVNKNSSPSKAIFKECLDMCTRHIKDPETNRAHDRDAADSRERESFDTHGHQDSGLSTSAASQSRGFSTETSPLPSHEDFEIDEHKGLDSLRNELHENVRTENDNRQIGTNPPGLNFGPYKSRDSNHLNTERFRNGLQTNGSLRNYLPRISEHPRIVTKRSETRSVDVDRSLIDSRRSSEDSGRSTMNSRYSMDSARSSNYSTSADRPRSSADRRRSSTDRKSSTDRRRSSTIRRQSSTDRRRSSTDRRRSSTDRRRSSTDRRRSSTDRRRSSTNRRRSSTDRKRSSVDRSQSSADPSRSSASRRRSLADPRRSSTDPRRSSTDPRPSSTDRRRSSTDRKRSSTDRRRSSVDPRRSSTDRRRSSTDHGRFSTYRRRSSTDRERTFYREQPSTNRGHSLTARRRSLTDRRRSSTNREQSSTDRGRSSTGRERSSSDRDRLSTGRERHSEDRRRSSADRRPPSTDEERPSTEREQSSDDRRRTKSERARSYTEHERSSTEHRLPSNDRERSSAGRRSTHERHSADRRSNEDFGCSKFFNKSNDSSRPVTEFLLTSSKYGKSTIDPQKSTVVCTRSNKLSRFSTPPSFSKRKSRNTLAGLHVPFQQDRRSITHNLKNINGVHRRFENKSLWTKKPKFSIVQDDAASQLDDSQKIASALISSESRYPSTSLRRSRDSRLKYTLYPVIAHHPKISSALMGSTGRYSGSIRVVRPGTKTITHTLGFNERSGLQRDPSTKDDVLDMMSLPSGTATLFGYQHSQPGEFPKYAYETWPVLHQPPELVMRKVKEQFIVIFAPGGRFIRKPLCRDLCAAEGSGSGSGSRESLGSSCSCACRPCASPRAGAARAAGAAAGAAGGLSERQRRRLLKHWSREGRGWNSMPFDSDPSSSSSSSSPSADALAAAPRDLKPFKLCACEHRVDVFLKEHVVSEAHSMSRCDCSDCVCTDCSLSNGSEEACDLAPPTHDEDPSHRATHSDYKLSEDSTYASSARQESRADTSEPISHYAEKSRLSKISESTTRPRSSKRVSVEHSESESRFTDHAPSRLRDSSEKFRRSQGTLEPFHDSTDDEDEEEVHVPCALLEENEEEHFSSPVEHRGHRRRSAARFRLPVSASAPSVAAWECRCPGRPSPPPRLHGRPAAPGARSPPLCTLSCTHAPASPTRTPSASKVHASRSTRAQPHHAGAESRASTRGMSVSRTETELRNVSESSDTSRHPERVSKVNTSKEIVSERRTSHPGSISEAVGAKPSLIDQSSQSVYHEDYQRRTVGTSPTNSAISQTENEERSESPQQAGRHSISKSSLRRLTHERDGSAVISSGTKIRRSVVKSEENVTGGRNFGDASLTPEKIREIIEETIPAPVLANIRQSVPGSIEKITSRVFSSINNNIANIAPKTSLSQRNEEPTLRRRSGTTPPLSRGDLEEIRGSVHKICSRERCKMHSMRRASSIRIPKPHISTGEIGSTNIKSSETRMHRSSLKRPTPPLSREASEEIRRIIHHDLCSRDKCKSSSNMRHVSSSRIPEESHSTPERDRSSVRRSSGTRIHRSSLKRPTSPLSRKASEEIDRFTHTDPYYRDLREELASSRRASYSKTSKHDLSTHERDGSAVVSSGTKTHRMSAASLKHSTPLSRDDNPRRTASKSYMRDTSRRTSLVRDVSPSRVSKHDLEHLREISKSEETARDTSRDTSRRTSRVRDVSPSRVSKHDLELLRKISKSVERARESSRPYTRKRTRKTSNIDNLTEKTLRRGSSIPSSKSSTKHISKTASTVQVFREDDGSENEERHKSSSKRTSRTDSTLRVSRSERGPDNEERRNSNTKSMEKSPSCLVSKMSGDERGRENEERRKTTKSMSKKSSTLRVSHDEDGAEREERHLTHRKSYTKSEKLQSTPSSFYHENKSSRKENRDPESHGKFEEAKSYRNTSLHKDGEPANPCRISKCHRHKLKQHSLKANERTSSRPRSPTSSGSSPITSSSSSSMDESSIKRSSKRKTAKSMSTIKESKKIRSDSSRKPEKKDPKAPPRDCLAICSPLKGKENRCIRSLTVPRCNKLEDSNTHGRPCRHLSRLNPQEIKCPGARDTRDGAGTCLPSMPFCQSGRCYDESAAITLSFGQMVLRSPRDNHDSTDSSNCDSGPLVCNQCSSIVSRQRERAACGGSRGRERRRVCDAEALREEMLRYAQLAEVAPSLWKRLLVLIVLTQVAALIYVHGSLGVFDLFGAYSGF